VFKFSFPKIIKLTPVCGYLCLIAPTATAGFITFHDLTDIVTVSTDLGSRVIVGNNCGTGETCTVTLSGPAEARRATGWDSGFNIYEPGSNKQIVSDILRISTTTNNIDETIFEITFTSDSDGAPLSPVAGLNGVEESGAVQFGGSITWGAPGVPTIFDTIQFQSDVEAAPEPSTLLLVGSVVAVAFARSRVDRRVRPSAR